MKRRILSIVAVVLVVAMLSVVLVACAPKDIDAAKAKLEKNYNFGGVDLGFLKVVGINVEGSVSASHKTEDGIAVTAIQFTNKEDAEKAEKFIKENLYDKYVANLDTEIKNADDDDTKAALKDAKAATTFKRSGNWIAFGHKKAVNKLFGL